MLRKGILTLVLSVLFIFTYPLYTFLPVGAGPRLHDEPSVGAVGVGHLPDEPRLPNSRFADEGHHLARSH